ncbi:unnamed protein product [Effrenium voratum]|nr:unnamed protein product [Effrenium voratum]
MGDQHPETEAVILRPPHEPGIFGQLGAHLRAGRLVAFPTETVYGLGANGLDAAAVLQIFEAKGRPLTDPCILHVANAADALNLLDMDALPDGRPLFEELTKAFWPGPLSIVGPARPAVPPEVTASTGFVAVRCPSHPIARQLVEAAGVPLAAPSANRFGHISPTLPEHVMEDLGHVSFLKILDGGPCDVGIESTVVKIDTAGRLLLLRRGGVTPERLEEFLGDCFKSGKLQEPVSLVSPSRSQPVVKAEEEAQVAPGMMLKHYAPSVHTVLLSPPRTAGAAEAASSGDFMKASVSRSVLIDFRAGQAERHGKFLKVFELCEAGSSGTAEEACRRVFGTLREAEAFAQAQQADLICIAEFDPSGLGGYAEALHDRLFRSASGQRAVLVEDGSKFLALRTMP